MVLCQRDMWSKHEIIFSCRISLKVAFHSRQSQCTMARPPKHKQEWHHWREGSKLSYSPGPLPSGIHTFYTVTVIMWQYLQDHMCWRITSLRCLPCVSLAFALEQDKRLWEQHLQLSKHPITDTHTPNISHSVPCVLLMHKQDISLSSSAYVCPAARVLYADR